MCVSIRVDFLGVCVLENKLVERRIAKENLMIFLGFVVYFQWSIIPVSDKKNIFHSPVFIYYPSIWLKYIDWIDGRNYSFKMLLRKRTDSAKRLTG